MPPRTHTRWVMRELSNGLYELSCDGEWVALCDDPNMLLSIFGDLAGGQG